MPQSTALKELLGQERKADEKYRETPEDGERVTRTRAHGAGAGEAPGEACAHGEGADPRPARRPEPRRAGD